MGNRWLLGEWRSRSFHWHPAVHGVVWNHGEIFDLGTLKGGYESIANAVNNQGQIVGYANNAVLDPEFNRWTGIADARGRMVEQQKYTTWVRWVALTP